MFLVFYIAYKGTWCKRCIEKRGWWTIDMHEILGRIAHWGSSRYSNSWSWHWHLWLYIIHLWGMGIEHWVDVWRIFIEVDQSFPSLGLIDVPTFSQVVEDAPISLLNTRVLIDRICNLMAHPYFHFLLSHQSCEKLNKTFDWKLKEHWEERWKHGLFHSWRSSSSSSFSLSFSLI